MLIRPAANSQIRNQGDDFIIRPKFGTNGVDGVFSVAISDTTLYTTQRGGIKFSRLSDEPLGSIGQFTKNHWWYLRAGSFTQSRDAGKTWDDSEIPPLVGVRLLLSYYPNKSKVAIAGYTVNVPGDRTVLYRSTDEGKTWTVCFDMPFRSDGGGVAYLGRGAYILADRSSRAYLSYDNGVTWNYVHLFNEALGNNVSIYSNRNGLVVSADERVSPLVISQDFGRTWANSIITPGVSTSWFGVCCSPDCLLVGTFKPSTGEYSLLRTRDFGATSVDVTPYPKATDRIWFMEWGRRPGLFYLTSAEFVSGLGVNGLWVTEDYGDSWTMISSGVIRSLAVDGRGNAFAMEYNSVAVGANLVSKDRGRTWMPLELPEEFTYLGKYYAKGW